VLGNPFAEAYLDFVCNFVDSKTAYYPTGEVKKVEESPEGVDTRAGLGYYTCGNGIEAQWKYAKFFLPKEAQPYTGKLCMYWENGRKKIESNIVDGLYFGKRTKWYQNGKKYSEEFFTKNATRSKAILYHKTGEVKSIKNY